MQVDALVGNLPLRGGGVFLFWCNKAFAPEEIT